MKKRIVILGGGISGLSLAWYLKKYSPESAITLIERKEQLGGWLSTLPCTDFFFERGPRTFQSVRAHALLKLTSELGLEDNLIFSEKKAKRRFLWTGQKLHLVPTHPWHFLRSSLGRHLLVSFWKERKKPAFALLEESLWDFATRRFDRKVAELFFDPMALGIYAGNSHTLSVNAAFAQLKEWEKEYGSVVKGLFRSKKGKSSLFTFKNGLFSLVQKLQEQLSAHICSGETVKALRFLEKTVEVETSKGVHTADVVFPTLAAPVMADLFRTLDSQIASLFSSFFYESLYLVYLGYKKQNFPHTAFGLLIPSCEKEEVLGVVFDSEIFPQQNREVDEVRLTVMVRGKDKEQEAVIQIAKEAVKRCCGFLATPDFVDLVAAKEAIPQYTMGHCQRVKELTDRLRAHYPNLTLVGNYLQGVSVNDCIHFAERSVRI